MIHDNFEAVTARIRQAAQASPFHQEVSLTAVTKNRSIEEMRELYECGQRVFGENRVQELLGKIPDFFPDAEFRLIGSLQKNKVKAITGKASLIESVDSESLLSAIDAAAGRMSIVQDILLQVNAAGEPQKHGFSPDELPFALKKAAGLENVCIRGLMMIAPDTADKEYLASIFALTRNLYYKLVEFSRKCDNMKVNTLSMGMTGDFEEAIAEGATCVRIGRALFA